MSTTLDTYDQRMSASENLAFDALADGVRRQILAILSERGECSVSEIAEHITAVGRTTVSSHLRVLRTSGVVSERKVGRHRYIRLDADGAAREAFEFLQRIMIQATTELGDSVASRSDTSEDELAAG